MLSAPILISTLVVGLLVSVFQALTQINEATLTFIPKMLVVALVIVLAVCQKHRKVNDKWLGCCPC